VEVGSSIRLQRWVILVQRFRVEYSIHYTSASVTTAISSESRSVWKVLGWALFLGMSWTWCIGMFLPVLLLRDYGFWAFVVFAAPNIVGAAAMGWVLTSAEQSQRLVVAHRAIFGWFSLATIVFHAFFLSWVVRRLVGARAGFGVVAAFLFFWMALQLPKAGRFVASVAAFLLSASFLGWGFLRGDFPFIAHPVAALEQPAIDVLWLIPVCVFGFGLCPYLDLTFHSARQDLSRDEARAAFGIGFGFIFLLMILCTRAYSGWLVGGLNLSAHPQIVLILASHLIVQSCLTAALHVHELSHKEHKIRVGQFVIFSSVLIVAVLLGAMDRPQPIYFGLRFGEIVYRSFLVFYGLVFPAYIWLCVAEPRRSTVRLGVVIAVALPLYWMGFIQRQAIFLVPGVAVAIVAKYLPEGRREVGSG
jgi:hypothetical protein